MRVAETDALAVGLETSPGKTARTIARRKQLRARLIEFVRSAQHGHEIDEQPTVGASDERDGGEAALARLFERSQECVSKGQYSLAIALLDRLLTDDSKNPNAWYLMGFSYGELGRRKDSISCYQRAVELRPGWSRAWSNLGWQRFRARQIDEALADLRRSVDIDPADAVGWHQLGIALLRTREIDKAVEAFENACSNDSNNEIYCLSLGRCLERSGRRREAVQWFKKACEINASYLPAWIVLATRAKGRGDWPRGPQRKPAKSVQIELELPNMGRVIKRESLIVDHRAIRSQDRMQKLVALFQDPIAWLVLFVLMALLYVLLGR